MNLDALFAPNSLAVVGASPSGNRGTAVLRNLERFGYTGTISVVHPKHDDVLGYPAYRSIDDVPDTPQLVVVATAADIAIDVVRQAADAGVEGAVLFASGFGEGDRRAHERAAALQAIAKGSGIAICGPNCYGVADLHRNSAPYSGAIVDDATAGNISYLLQSGALSHALHDSLLGRGVGIAKVVTTGNELGVGLGTYLDYVADDDTTDVIVMLIEAIRDIDAFTGGAKRAVASGKRLVALKLGRSSRGQLTARAHTGAVAGAAVRYSGLFRSMGIQEVSDLDELREAALLHAITAKTRQREVRADSGAAFLSISGGACSLVADLAEEARLPLADLTEATRQEMAAVLPDFAHVENPLDMTGAAARDADLVRNAAATLGRAVEVGSLTLLFNVGEASPSQQDLYRDHARAFADVVGDLDMPVAAMSVVAGSVDPALVEILHTAGIPMVSGARAGVRAIAGWHRRDARRASANHSSTTRENRTIVGEGSDTARSLTGLAALNALEVHGVPVPSSLVTRDVEEAIVAAGRYGYPVVLKVDSERLEHKTEVGGVVAGIADADELRTTFDTLLSRAATSGVDDAEVLVQQQVDGVAEVLVGVVTDPQLGHIMVVGAGGILVELLRDVSSAPLPVSRDQAKELIAESSMAQLLAGFRGAPPGDIDALAELITAVSAYVEADPSVTSIDLNPVIVCPNGRGVVAVDALVVY